MHPLRGGTGHRSRHTHHGPVEERCPVRGVQGAAADRGLHDHGAERHGGDQPVAGQETQLGRGAARRYLRHDQPGLCDIGQQVTVGGRVGTVDTARQDRHRRASSRQRPSMCGLVDPERRPRHDCHPLTGQVRGDLPGHRGPVRRRRARPDHRDRALGKLVETPRATHPQAQGCPTSTVEHLRAVEVLEPHGPLLVAGADEADALVGGPLQVTFGVEAAQTGRHVGGHPVHVTFLTQVGLNLRCPDLGHQPGEAGVARLPEPAECDPGDPVT